MDRSNESDRGCFSSSGVRERGVGGGGEVVKVVMCVFGRVVARLEASASTAGWVHEILRGQQLICVVVI
jgi:hypothetical protein